MIYNIKKNVFKEIFNGMGNVSDIIVIKKLD